MARRKITRTDKADQGDDSGLPELTPQQREFVKGILDGKSASDAYRAAYNCENMASKSIWVDASRLRHHPNVVLWLSAAHRANISSAVLTKEDHLRELARLREIGLDSGNVGAAVQAEKIRGEVAGHRIERYEDVTRNPMETLAELTAIVRDILGPDAADKFAHHFATDAKITVPDGVKIDGESLH